jgi:hypothetical protein
VRDCHLLPVHFLGPQIRGSGNRQSSIPTALGIPDSIGGTASGGLLGECQVPAPPTTREVSGDSAAVRSWPAPPDTLGARRWRWHLPTWAGTADSVSGDGVADPREVTAVLNCVTVRGHLGDYGAGHGKDGSSR